MEITVQQPLKKSHNFVLKILSPVNLKAFVSFSQFSWLERRQEWALYDKVLEKEKHSSRS